MFGLIFSLVFCFFAGLFVLKGAMGGRKYIWQLSLARIIVVIVSAILAAILATVISNAAAKLLLNAAIDNGWFGSVGDMINDLPSGASAAGALGSMFVSPILFIPLFLIIKAILNAFSKLVALLIAKISSGKVVEEDAEASEGEGADEAAGVTEEVAESTEEYAEGEAAFEEAEAKQAYVPEYDEHGRRIVTRKHYKKRYKSLVAEYANPVGAILGAVCSVLVFCVLLIPMVGAIETVNNIVPIVGDMIPEEEEEISEIVDLGLEVMNAADNNLGSLIVKYSGGKLLYGTMTTGIVNGEMTNLNKEGAFFSSLLDSVAIVLNTDASAAKKADVIREISPAFDKSVITRTLLSELCSTAGQEWEDGEDFHGIDRPEVGGDYEDIFSSLINVFATSDSENIKQDFHSIVEAVAVLFEREAANDIQNDPMSLLENEEVTAELLSSFLDNERLDPMVDGVADFGINILLDTVSTPDTLDGLYNQFVNSFLGVHESDEEALAKAYSDVFDDYGLRVDEDTLAFAVESKLEGDDMHDWLYMHIAANEKEFIEKTEIISAEMITEGRATIVNDEHEAEALAHAFAVVYGMTTDLRGDSFNTKTIIGKFGPALDSFTMTETIGPEKTGLVLTAVLQSKMIHDQLGMSVIEATDTSGSIVENSGKRNYESVMNSLAGIIDVLEAAADKGTDTKEAVDKMLDNLTPEAANVMQTMSTPSVVKNYGVPEANAEPVANMISNTFGNLQDVPAEDYDRESAAVADMMNVMMSMGSSSGSTFGDENSDTQLTADEYVTNIMDSTAMSKTVVDTVYGEGDEPQVDPMKSNRNLTEAERADLLASLNAKWAASEKDEATRREIISIAAMMNMTVEVTDAGVTEVVNEEIPA